MMRVSVRNLAELIVIASIAICSVCPVKAQTCSQPPAVPNLNPSEASADNAFEAAVTDSGGCTKAGDAGCTQATNAFNTLSTQALSASGESAQCAATGSNTAGVPLSASDKAWYLKRSSFWSGVYQSLQTQASAVANGTYKLSDQDRANFLGVTPPAKAAVQGAPIQWALLH